MLIRKYLDNDYFVCDAFIDLQKAFDTINHDILFAKREHYSGLGQANDCLRSFLINWKRYVHISGYSSVLKNVLCGAPQGSTLGHLLFFSVY